MSYTYSNRIRYSDSPDLDAFGRLRSSSIFSLLEFKHTNNKLSLLIDEKLNGASTSTLDSINSKVEMTVTNSGDYAIRQSKSRAIHQLGKSQIIESSVSSFNLETNVIKRIGYFHSSDSSPYNTGLDGLFLESNGATGVISFQIWKSGSNILNSNISNWLDDDYDSSLIDWSLSQLMFIDFQWMGRVRFGMVIEGTNRIFVTHTGVNNLSDSYMSSPNQPIRYEIRSSGGSGSLGMISSQVSSEGNLENTEKTTSVNGFQEITCGASNSYVGLGIRINGNYEGSTILLKNLQTLCTTSSYFLATIQINPVLSSSPTFTNITDTPVDYVLGDGTLSVITPGHIVASFLGNGSSLQNEIFEIKETLLKPGINIDGSSDEWYLIIETTSSSQKFRRVANISYYE